MDRIAVLPANDRATVFEETAARRGIANAGIVEKDFWVCWTLHRLHAIPGRPRLLFKGGTSLSKCFQLIHRFSEDIDLGIEREDLGLGELEHVQCLMGDLTPSTGTSRKAYERGVEAMKARVHEYVLETFFPAIEGDFRSVLDEEFSLHPPDSADGDPTILFEYPSSLGRTGSDGYMAPVVRFELGARSDHEPVRTVAIKPYAAEEFASEFTQPSCEVVAQAPERTLLEKALILHAANHRGRIRNLSARHAYDLAMMNRDRETTSAVTRDLFERVAFHKFVFGENATVRDAPSNGINLVPRGDVLRELEADYRNMRPMFFAQPAAPSFEDVLAELGRLEGTLRAL